MKMFTKKKKKKKDFLLINNNINQELISLDNQIFRQTISFRMLGLHTKIQLEIVSKCLWLEN